MTNSVVSAGEDSLGISYAAWKHYKVLHDTSQWENKCSSVHKCQPGKKTDCYDWLRFKMWPVFDGLKSQQDFKEAQSPNLTE